MTSAERFARIYALWRQLQELRGTPKSEAYQQVFEALRVEVEQWKAEQTKDS